MTRRRAGRASGSGTPVTMTASLKLLPTHKERRRLHRGRCGSPWILISAIAARHDIVEVAIGVAAGHVAGKNDSFTRSACRLTASGIRAEGAAVSPQGRSNSRAAIVGPAVNELRRFRPRQRRCVVRRRAARSPCRAWHVPWSPDAPVDIGWRQITYRGRFPSCPYCRKSWVSGRNAERTRLTNFGGQVSTPAFCSDTQATAQRSVLELGERESSWIQSGGTAAMTVVCCAGAQAGDDLD